MEFGPPTSPETKKDTEDSKEKKKKTTTTGRAAIQAESVPAAPRLPEAGQRRDTVVESIWQKIKGESAKPKDVDLPLFGIKKPELTNKLDTTADRIGETDPEETVELHAAASDFAELRQKAADGELYDLPLDQHDSPHAAAAAADSLLMRAVQENLQDASKPVGEALDAAEQQVTETIAAVEPAGEPGEENIGENARESAPEQGDVEVVPDTSNVIASGPEHIAIAPETPSETPDEQPPHPSGTPPGPPVGPPRNLADGPGGMPPHFGYNGMPQSVAASETAPAFVSPPSPNVAPQTRDYGSERAAAARGLLVGAVIGYFGGRRRGRTQGAARAEKQFAPVRRNLEKQVKNLQETITAKESRIRQVAREKVGAMNQSQERKKVIDRLVGPPSVAETVIMPAAAVEAAVVAARPVGEVYSRTAQAAETSSAAVSSSTEVLINQRYGQEVVPADPVAAVAGLAAAHERTVNQPLTREQIAPAQIAAEQAAVIPFNKKAEDFSKAELMQTAEKVKVAGVSLKEMAELGRLDEPALRRVIGEFLEGGNVSAAVARETKEKDIKYERDPSLRKPAGAGQVSGGGAANSGGTTTGGQSGISGAAQQAAQNQQSAANASYSGPAPTPDAATLKAVRDKQLAAVTTGTVAVALIVLVLALLLR